MGFLLKIALAYCIGGYKMKCVNLIIAAHPDDEVLGCGGMISKNSDNEDFYVLILTAGANTRYGEFMEKTLRDNAIQANKIVGTKEVFFENLPNQGLETIALIDIIKIIERYITLLKPTKLFTQHGGDLNKDHKIVYEASVTAARPVVGQIVRELYTYNVPSSTEWNFTHGQIHFIPNIFMDIKETIEKKIDAMRCYESECRPYPHPRSPESVDIHANYWGLSVGLEFAEPFMLIRKIV